MGRRHAAGPRQISPSGLPGIVLLFGAVLAAYLPALNGGLLWDDAGHVTAAGLQSLHGLWRIWFEPGATQQYYPLLHTAFWVEHHLWGDSVLGYHLTNVLLHAASACLLAIILRFVRLRGAWLAAFVFALHPVCVEAVAWISEQKSTLSGFFYLASALCYLHFDRSRRKGSQLTGVRLIPPGGSEQDRNCHLASRAAGGPLVAARTAQLPARPRAAGSLAGSERRRGGRDILCRD